MLKEALWKAHAVPSPFSLSLSAAIPIPEGNLALGKLLLTLAQGPGRRPRSGPSLPISLVDSSVTVVGSGWTALQDPPP